MPTAFRKMHGIGNDFMVLDARVGRLNLTPACIHALADRRTGVGWDQLIVIEAASRPGADAAIRIYNPDGSEAGACGNATRCVATLLTEETGRICVLIETVSGVLAAECLADGRVQVDMGPPRLGWREVPLRASCDTLWLDVPGVPAAVSMGNPHVTLFVAAIDAVDPATAGPVLEHHPMFPDRANIGFAQVLAPDRIRLRVWERGAGLTRACGSGACAALVNAHRRGLAGRRAELVLDGGTLLIEWRTPEQPSQDRQDRPGADRSGAIEHRAIEHGATGRGLSEHGAGEHRTGEHGRSEHGLSEHGLSEHGASEHGASEHGASEHGAVEHGAVDCGTIAHGVIAHGAAGRGGDGRDRHGADGYSGEEQGEDGHAQARQGHVWMTGPAMTAFHGTVDLTTYGA